MLSFFKKITKITNQHYPERCQKILIVNSPMAFAMVWKIIKPWIAPATSEKVLICRAGNDTSVAMKEQIGMNEMPKEYGGALEYGSQSKYEREFQRYVHSLNKKVTQNN